MISPAPAGVDPNNSICGECGGWFSMPFMGMEKDESGYNVRIYALRCSGNPDHETYVSKNLGATKILTGPEGQKVEVDVLTQKPITGGAIEAVDYETALARVEQAHSMGLFPESKNQPVTLAQKQAVAMVALAYELDPLMNEVIPMYGHPYITIDGRRRKDEQAGHRIKLRYRPCTAEEKEEWEVKPNDLSGWAIVEDVVTGASVESFGRILAAERDPKRQGADNLPQVKFDIEMLHKRCERSGREKLWGPIEKPKGLENLLILQEGDESNIVEGSARVIPNNEPSQPQGNPEDNACPVHSMVWFKSGKMQEEAHAIEGEKGPRGGAVWCNKAEMVANITNRFIAQAATWDEALKQDWRDRWRGMSISERYQAIVALENEKADPATGEMTGEIDQPNIDGLEPLDPIDPDSNGDVHDPGVPMPNDEEQESAAAYVGDEPNF